MSRNFGILVSALLVSVVTAAQAPAAVLVLDTFEDAGTVGTALTDRTPTPTDQPGTTYSTFLGQGGGIVAGQAVVGADSGVALDISADNASNILRISGDVSYNPGSPSPADGAGLGFWPSKPIAHGFSNFGTPPEFRGVTLGLDGSNHAQLALMQGFTELATIPLGSLLDVTTLHALSYAIDRSPGVGTISDLTLDGTPYSFSTNIFTQANTQFAGFGNHGVAGGDQAHFDNFELENSVPEPTSLGILAIGAMSIGLRRRR